MPRSAKWFIVLTALLFLPSCAPRTLIKGGGQANASNACSARRYKADPVVEAKPEPCQTLAVTSSRHRVTFTLQDSTKLVIDSRTAPGNYWLKDRRSVYVSDIKGYPRFYTVCPPINRDIKFTPPDDNIIFSFNRENDDFLYRQTSYGSIKIDSLMVKLNKFLDTNNRVPTPVEADSLFGLPNTYRADAWTRRGRVTYAYIDSFHFRLDFWDIAGLRSGAFGSIWGQSSDNEENPEADEWFGVEIPSWHITHSMFGCYADSRWSYESIVTKMEEITTRRRFKNLEVRDAPGLLDLERVVVQAVEYSDFPPELKPRAIAAIKGFIDVLRDEGLKSRLQAYLKKIE